MTFSETGAVGRRTRWKGRGGRKHCLTRTAWAILLIAVVGWVAVSPSNAAAHNVIRGHRSWGFELAGSNGYTLSVTVFGRHSVEVDATGSGGIVSYSVPAHWTSDGHVRARIGQVGHLSGRFRPSRPPTQTTEPQGDCKGRRALGQPGAFVGDFQFRGEQGFTSAKATRIQAMAIHSFKEVCNGNADGGRDNNPGQPGRRESTTVTARSRARGRITEFVALSSSLETRFEASVVERHRGALIERQVAAEGREEDVAVNPDGGTVTVSPPMPFNGSAVLEKSAGLPTSWSGSLTAFFPGLGRVSLAGSRFTAHASAADGGQPST